MNKHISGRSELCDPLVLVAKDDQMSRKLTCDLLKSRGYRVLEVKNAKRVVEATLQNNPDLVLVDFSCHNDAIDSMVEKICKEGRLAQVPFLTVSDKEHTLNIINDFSKETDMSVLKPASTKSIVDKIETILAKLKKYASR